MINLLLAESRVKCEILQKRDVKNVKFTEELIVVVLENLVNTYLIKGVKFYKQF